MSAADNALLEKLRRLAERPGTTGEGMAAQAALNRVRARVEWQQPLLGRRIERPKACVRCGSRTFIVEPPKGPHGHHLRCAGCNRGGTWLPKAEAAKMSNGGAPS